MNFVDLKKSLKDNIENNYLLVGGDLFLLNKSYELILNALNLSMPDFNLQVFASDEIDLKICADACNVLPIMDEKRVVYINASIKCGVSNIDALKKYFNNPNPSTVLIVNAGENASLFESIKSNFEIVDCNKVTQNIVNGFILSELKKSNKNISNEALALLFNYTNGDLSRIENELTKLVSYALDRKTIEANDVKAITTKSIDFQIYELTDALAKKNSEKVYEILGVLKSKKDSYRTLVSLIYNHFRRLLYVAISKDSRQELSTMLGIKEFAVTKLMEQSRLFNTKKLKAINDLCVSLDYDVKQSKVASDMAVEYLVLSILNM